MRLAYGERRNPAVRNRLFPKLLVLAEVVVIALISCKSKPEYDYDGAMPAATARNNLAVERIMACRNFEDVKKELSNFAGFLVGKRDSTVLYETYETIRKNMLAVMNRSKDDSKPYVDDLTMLAQEFGQRKTDGEKMAIVFLALPRLFEREMTIVIQEPLGLTIEQVRLTAEQDFLKIVGRDMPKLARLMRKYWYKEEMAPPTEHDKTKFFEELAKLY